MSRNYTIARPYAKAAFELAQMQKAFSLWSDMITVATQVATDERVMLLMKDPKVPVEQLMQLFLDAGKDLFTPEMHNFIHILGTAKRLSCLSEIKELYEEMRAQAESVMTVELISAVPMTDDFRERFTQALKKRMQRDILLECVVDKNILGGAILRSGDFVMDGSIRGRLSKLSDALSISI